MNAPTAIVLTTVAVGVSALSAQPPQITNDPFPTPILASGDAIAVHVVEFAAVPDFNGEPPRLMHLVDEPGTRRMFVSTMRGRLYTVSYDGRTVKQYLDINDPPGTANVQSQGRESGFQSFAFHPQFNQPGAPGYGKFYTYADSRNTTPKADFLPSGGERPQDTVLLEWTAKTPEAATYDGGAARELIRLAQPYDNHNGGEISFNTLAAPGSPEYGLLYMGVADGGAGGDPFGHAQNLGSAFGKIFRIDPLGNTSANQRYGIPPANPFAAKAGALGEIYAYGVRNPQRFAWDAKTGRMFVADIGQNAVEEISPVTAGANLGWNVWEGSFRYVNWQVNISGARSEPGFTWPVVEFDHHDPLLRRTAITGVYVYRASAINQLEHRLIFGDMVSGELFSVDADNLPNGGQSAIRRILLTDKGTPRTLLQLIGEKRAAQGKPAPPRADLRLGMGPEGQIFVLNKQDGVIRLLVPDAVTSSP
jgi:Glucose / Sorbosone dehydrogenase